MPAVACQCIDRREHILHIQHIESFDRAVVTLHVSPAGSWSSIGAPGYKLNTQQLTRPVAARVQVGQQKSQWPS